MPKKLISYIVPCYNEADGLIIFYKNLLSVLKTSKKYDYEIIFIDDGSIDNTVNTIEEIIKKDKKVKLIEFSRNFGKESAVSAGLHHAKGASAIILDADLQHPPKYIPDFVEKWQDGAEMVVGIRENNDHAKLSDRITSFIFYKVISFIKDTPLGLNETDFRLLDRVVIDAFNGLQEKNRITRGMLDWLGFRREFINFRADERIFGETKYNQFRRAKLALDTVISHSQFPVYVISYLGGFIVCLSGILGVFIIVEKYILDDLLGLKISGTASLGTLTLFLIGIILTALGVLSQYILKIRDETMNRPLYVIRKKR